MTTASVAGAFDPVGAEKLVRTCDLWFPRGAVAGAMALRDCAIHANRSGRVGAPRTSRNCWSYNPAINATLRPAAMDSRHAQANSNPLRSFPHTLLSDGPQLCDATSRDRTRRSSELRPGRIALPREVSGRRRSRRASRNPRPRTWQRRRRLRGAGAAADRRPEPAIARGRA